MVRSRRAPRRALVLGAGAALGGAWSVGVLCALESVEGFRPDDVDLVVGTSAGSVLAALIACGLSPGALAERLAGAGSTDVEGTGPVNPFDVHDYVHSALGDIPRPTLLPSNLRLAARAAGRPHRHTLMTAAAALAPRGRGDLAPVRALIADEYRRRAWPVEPAVWVVAMDARTGRRTVFGRAGSPVVPLPDAVVASCSAPGFFPPARIGDHWYVDGGAVSATNADVLLRERFDEALVLAPMAMLDRHWTSNPIGWAERRLRALITRRLRWEVRALQQAGCAVRVFVPSAADLDAMGHNVMDPRRRRQVFETAFASTTERLRARRDGRGTWPPETATAPAEAAAAPSDAQAL